MPDPKLKEAMEEVKAILAKHDIAAIVVLASQTHGEHLYHVNPSWSCVKLEGDALRIKAQRQDFPDLETQKKCVTESVGMLAVFMDVANIASKNMESMLEVIGQHIEFTNRSYRDDG